LTSILVIVGGGNIHNGATYLEGHLGSLNGDIDRGSHHSPKTRTEWQRHKNQQRTSHQLHLSIPPGSALSSVWEPPSCHKPTAETSKTPKLQKLALTEQIKSSTYTVST